LFCPPAAVNNLTMFRAPLPGGGGDHELINQ